MNVKLYATTSPKIQVNKSISLIADITGEPHETISDIEMTIRFSIDRLTSIKESNYCYIETTGKYYYINPDYKIDNHVVTVALKEDVLMSLKSQLLQQTCTISRNERVGNAYLYDDGYQLLAYKNIVTKTFPNSIDDNTIILMTVG